MNTRLLIAALGTLFGCAACGFKGPLYLPQQNAAVVTHPATETAVPTAPVNKPATTPHKTKQKKADSGTATPP